MNINYHDCTCLQNFASGKYELLNDNFLSKLIELKLLEVIHPPYDFINIRYHLTEIGESIVDKINNNPNYFQELNEMIKIIYSSELETNIVLRNSFCCEFVLYVAVDLNKHFS